MSHHSVYIWKSCGDWKSGDMCKLGWMHAVMNLHIRQEPDCKVIIKSSLTEAYLGSTAQPDYWEGARKGTNIVCQHHAGQFTPAVGCSSEQEQKQEIQQQGLCKGMHITERMLLECYNNTRPGSFQRPEWRTAFIRRTAKPEYRHNSSLRNTIICWGSTNWVELRLHNIGWETKRIKALWRSWLCHSYNSDR